MICKEDYSFWKVNSMGNNKDFKSLTKLFHNIFDIIPFLSLTDIFHFFSKLSSYLW